MGIAHGRAVVGAQAEEVRLDRGIVRVGYLQAVGPVAAHDVIEHERAGRRQAADERVVVGAEDVHAVQRVAQGDAAARGSANIIAAELIQCGSAGDQHAVVSCSIKIKISPDSAPG